MLNIQLHNFLEFTQLKEIPIQKSNLLTTLPHLGKIYFLSFEVKPSSLGSGSENILHFTTGGDNIRIPAVFFVNGILTIFSEVNGNGNYEYKCIKKYPANKWINIQIYQELIGERYIFKIIVDGKTVHQIENKIPKDFYNVKIYVSDPWATNCKGIIRNLLITEENKKGIKIVIEMYLYL